MIGSLLRKKGSKDTRPSKKPGPPDKQLASQISDIRQQLITYIHQTTQNFLIFNNRLNALQAEVAQLRTETSENTEIDVDRLRTMETQIAELSGEIAKINKAIYVNIRDCFEDLIDFIDEKKSKKELTMF